MDNFINENACQTPVAQTGRCEDVVLAVSDLYIMMCVLDLEDQSCVVIKSGGNIESWPTSRASLQWCLAVITGKLASPDSLPAIRAFTSLATLKHRLEGKQSVSELFHTKVNGWWKATFVRVGEGPLRRVLFIIEDVNDQIGQLEEQRKLQELIYVDPLTRVKNRRFYDERIASKDCQAVIMADIDDFKRVNDFQGHQCGDDALVAVAEVLISCVRDTDDVIRYGGDEFIIAFEEITKEALQRRMEEMRSAVERVQLERYPHVHLTTSVGAAFGQGKTSDMIDTADKALYESKEHKNTTTILSFGS